MNMITSEALSGSCKSQHKCKHYHLRSNVESTDMAIKAKLGDSVKSKNFTAQANEVLCKLIAYNITVLISAIYELKIEPKLFALSL